ncbi:MAG TPA: phospho-N-acetylmuramoyl-pentapeptide-transferase [Candidatus Tyrphobacter sp.]
MTPADLQAFALEAAGGFVIALGVGWLLLRLLPRFAFRQTAYEDAPESHRRKSGTPTMGGIAILAAIAVAWIFERDSGTDALFFLLTGCAAVGFLDDYLGTRRGTNSGLRARTKFLATALLATIFMRLVDGVDYHVGMGTWLFPPDTLFHTGAFAIVVPHWLWFSLGILAVTGAANAVNLTDGLDGLAAGAIVPPLYVFWTLAIAMLVPRGDHWPAMLPVAIGGCIGFLVYNRHPARMFMGDTGSLALGALLAGAAIVEGQMLLLLVVGGLFVAEALSVMLQVAYFKISGGRRIFRMSPLHHHFELAGWPESVVTLRFWLASALCSVVGWIIGHAR